MGTVQKHWIVVSLTTLLVSCGAKTTETTHATIEFKKDGVSVGVWSTEQLTSTAAAETWSAYDPYYNKKKSFRAIPLHPLLNRAFGDKANWSKEQFILKAKDGYTVPLEGNRLAEEGVYIAIADTEVPGWEPIGPQRANPGPYYLVWRGEKQQDLTTHPRPWQLATIEITAFEKVFPHTAPTGAQADSAASKGYAVFRTECIRCHAINREGGRIGPDLNVPQSIVEYRPVAQIKQYIRDPKVFRHGNMPAHPHLDDAALDSLIAYFDYMKTKKYDPQ